MAGQQVYSVNTLGGNFSQVELTDMLRKVTQPNFVFRDFVSSHEAFGKGRGDTVEFAKRGNVATQGGTLVETATVPRTNYTSWRGTATIYEYGNSVGFTEKHSLYSKFPVEQQVREALADDAVKVLESAAGDQFVASEWVGVCVSTASTDIVTTGTATTTATANLSASNIRDFVKFLEKKNVPKYDGNNYMCIASIEAAYGLHDDVGTGGWVDISKYTERYAAQVHGAEMGTYFNLRIMKETGYLSNDIGASSAYGQAVIFGDDYVMEGEAMAETVRTDSDDYERSQGVAWLAHLGYKIVWQPSVDGANNGRGIFITSA